MLAQQEVAFARSAKQVGEKIEVLIDSCAGDVDEGGRLYVGRTYRQAPDIDSATYVHDPLGRLKIGQFTDATITDWQHYDHVARVRRPAALPVVG